MTIATTMKRRFSLAACIAALLLLTPLASAPAQSTGDDEQDGPPLATGETLQEILEMIRNSREYQAMRGLEATDELLKRIDEFKETSPYTIKVHNTTFIDKVLFDSGRFSFWLASRESLNIRTVHRGQRGVIVTASIPDRDIAFRLAVSDLQEMNFTFVRTVVVVHPLNKRLARFDVDQEPFNSVVEQLCLAADNNEVAFNSGAAYKLGVTLRLRNRTVRECLEMAAHAVDWSVSFHSPTADDRRQRVVEAGPRNATFRWTYNGYAYEDRALENLRAGEELIASHADALLLSLERHAPSRLIVVLMPPEDDNE